MKKIFKKINLLITLSFCLFSSFFSIALAQGGGIYFPTFAETGLPSPPGGVIGVLAVILGWILMVTGFLAIISFVIAGIIYLTAAGDEDRAKVGKRAMLYSIIGVVISLSGLVIIRVVYGLLGGVFTLWIL